VSKVLNCRSDVRFGRALPGSVSLVLRTTCMRSCCNWSSNCVAVYQTKTKTKDCVSMPRMCFQFAMDSERPKALSWADNACRNRINSPCGTIEARPNLVLACGICKRRPRRSTAAPSPSSLACNVPLSRILVTLLLCQVRVALLRTAFASKV